MKQQEESDPKVERAEKELANILCNYMGMPITYEFIARVQETIDDFRVTQLLHGVKLPKMVIVWLPLAGYVQVWPAELELKDLQLRLKNLIRMLQAESRNYDPVELAAAIDRAYPDYKQKLSLKVLHH